MQSCWKSIYLLHTGVITKVPRASPSFPVKCDTAIEAGRFGFGQIKKAVLEANNLWKGILIYRSGHVHGNSLEAIYKDQMPKRIQNRSVIKP